MKISPSIFAMESAAMQLCQQFGVMQGLRSRAGSEQPCSFQMIDGIAEITCIGMLSRYGDDFGGPSSQALGEYMKWAAERDNCSGILLRLDSAGGPNEGICAAASRIAAAARMKPTWCSVEGGAIGTAYWLASQCNRIFATRGSTVGGIGTFSVIYDRSEEFEKAGLKVHVVKAGKHKGDFTAGTVVTDDQLAAHGSVVDQLNALFVSAVQRGRRWSRAVASERSDGRVHVGEHALALGLIDDIGDDEDALKNLQRMTRV